MSTVERNRLHPRFVLGWVLLTTGGGVMAFWVCGLPISIVGTLLDGSEFGRRIHANDWPLLAVFLIHAGIAIAQWESLRDEDQLQLRLGWWMPASFAGAILGIAVMAVVYPLIWNDVYENINGPGISGNMRERGSFYNEDIVGWGNEPLRFDFNLYPGESEIMRKIRTAELRYEQWQRQKPLTKDFDVKTAQAMAWAWSAAATLFAVPVGVMQWIALRRRVPRFWLWIPTMVVGALLGSVCVGLGVILDANITGGTTSYSPPGLIGLIGMLLGTIVFSTITGAGMARLLRGVATAQAVQARRWESQIDGS